MSEKLEPAFDFVRANVDEDGTVRFSFGKRMNEKAKVKNSQHFKLEINGDGRIIFTPIDPAKV